MNIAVGDKLPDLIKRIDLVDMVAYAGATWDWYKLHYDSEVVKEQNLPGPIVDGQVFGAFCVEQIQDWAGPLSFVKKLDFTFRNLVFAGETVRCEGVVTEVADSMITVSQRVVVINDEGEEQRAAAEPCTAQVLIGVADGQVV